MNFRNYIALFLLTIALVIFYTNLLIVITKVLLTVAPSVIKINVYALIGQIALSFCIMYIAISMFRF